MYIANGCCTICPIICSDYWFKMIGEDEIKFGYDFESRISEESIFRQRLRKDNDCLRKASIWIKMKF